MLPATAVTISPPSATGEVVAGRTLTRSGTGSYGYLLRGFEVEVKRELLRVRTPFVRGEIVTPGPHGAAQLTVRGTLVGRTEAEFWTLRGTLTAACGDWGADPVTLIAAVPGIGDVEWEAHADQTPIKWANVNAFAADFEASFIASDPAGFSTTALASGIGSVAVPASATVAGSAEVFPVVTVAAASGTVTAVTVENLSTGQELVLTGLSLTAGEDLTIDMTPGFESITEGGISRMGSKNPASRFWGLRPGVNLLAVTFTGGTATASAAWRDGWLF